MIRIFTLVFTVDMGYFYPVLLVMAALTMITGVLGAAAQNEFRRILSFHIISQVGYMLLGSPIFLPCTPFGIVRLLDESGIDPKGKKVTIVGREKTAGFDVNPSFKWRYMIYLRQNGVMAYNDCDIEEINDGEIIVKTFDGYRFPVKCDTVVVSEREANDSLKKGVQAEGIELFVIGDALVPRNLSSAVHDGYRIGLRI
mgnify:CR=1 FL=1